MEQSSTTTIAGTPSRRRLILLLSAVLVILGAGAGLYLVNRAPQNGSATIAKTDYTCPMHPQVHSDHPGECPICHMDLVPTARETSGTTGQNEIQLSASALIKANVGVWRVRNGQVSSNISAVGVGAVAETGQKTIVAYTGGRIEKIYGASTGSFVAKGAPLYDFYSPDLLNAEAEYLVALRSQKSLAHVTSMPEMESHHESLKASMVSASKDRLSLLGMTSAQISALETSGRVAQSVTVRAPMSGVVMTRNADAGAYVNEGAAILQLADLSQLWVYLDVSEQDIRLVRPGGAVVLRAEAYPDEVFHGRVTLIAPVVDPSTRTTRVRVTVPNPAGRLRPEMFFTADIVAQERHGLVVPVAAVIRSGDRDIVWVSKGAGQFAPQQVVTGIRSGEYYEILSGLNAGDEVAAEGGFLIDSEHQLRTGNNPMAGMNMSAGDEGSRTEGETTGIVRGVDQSAGTISLDHGNIPGVMSAMTMSYKAGNPAMLRLESGSEIRFTLEKKPNGDYVVTKASPVKTGGKR